MACYSDFATFLNRHFSEKVQKISINAGFTCPNRDGTKGVGGCTYCNNQTFSPGYCRPQKSVAEQLEEGKRFFAHKYPHMRYIAYFQAYTNTYATLRQLETLYAEALAVDGVVGLIIGTRPDCVDDELLDYLKNLAEQRFVMVEYGAETSHNRTLAAVNRGHTWEQTVDAVCRTAERGIPCGLHLILGLPGESRRDILTTVERASALPVDTLKMHQLQIVRGTKMARQVETGEIDYHEMSVDEYIDLCCEVVEHCREGVCIERFVSQSPAELLLSPRWGLKNYEFTNLLNRELTRRGIRQGSKYGT
ncbi:MAG: TIGR01212 family radical SAM protein [Bacteroidales bacterium]|nr:TIGR01212 family radical SAM protein [Bacteroidales bacterium]MDD6622878.1 TIGR01212 family radical SAM protein [Bacteroidales bacterium]